MSTISRQQFKETIDPQLFTIVEDNKPSGHLKVKGLFQLADTVNGNGRLYPKSLWEKILQDNDFQERLRTRRVLGEV